MDGVFSFVALQPAKEPYMTNHERCEKLIDTLADLNFSNEGIENFKHIPSMLDSLQGMADRLQLYNFGSMDEKRKSALEIVDKNILEMQKKLDEVRAGADLRNHCLLPLQTIRSEIEKETTIPAIVSLQIRFDEFYVERMEDICERYDDIGEGNIDLPTEFPERATLHDNDFSIIEEYWKSLLSSGEPVEEDASGTLTQADITFDNLFQKRDNADMWLELSHWGKQTQRLTPKERRIIFCLGKLIQNGTRLNTNQEVWALTVLEDACEKGFDYIPF